MTPRLTVPQGLEWEFSRLNSHPHSKPHQAPPHRGGRLRAIAVKRFRDRSCAKCLGHPRKGVFALERSGNLFANSAR